MRTGQKKRTLSRRILFEGVARHTGRCQWIADVSSTTYLLNRQMSRFTLHPFQCENYRTSDSIILSDEVNSPERLQMYVWPLTATLTKV